MVASRPDSTTRSPRATSAGTDGRAGSPGQACGDGRYLPLFAIGRGGMGRVEVALDRCPDGSERVVAIKRLLPDAARDPRRNEMFLREARIAAALDHPSVVHAFAFGESGGDLFLAMEYVEGESLLRVLAAARESREPLAPELVAMILAQVCDGLHAAHELRGATGESLQVVHRDVSPHNVMIAYDGRVKVLDFGVAKLEATSDETRSGEVKGKMAYMSPEQALGDPLDRRSDLFSVGAVLFECLAGRRMWGSGTDLTVMRRLALEDPPNLHHAALGAPPALVSVFSRLTARERWGRPETARDVANELRAFAATRCFGDEVAALRRLMDHHFRREAEDRRRLLAEALAEAPLRERTLENAAQHRSLEPFAIGSTAAEDPSESAGAGRYVVGRRALVGPRHWSRRIVPLMAGIVAGMIAVIVYVRGVERSPRPPRVESVLVPAPVVDTASAAGGGVSAAPSTFRPLAPDMTAEKGPMALLPLSAQESPVRAGMCAPRGSGKNADGGKSNGLSPCLFGPVAPLHNAKPPTPKRGTHLHSHLDSLDSTLY